MMREFVIRVEVDAALEVMLQNIRWKHIDLESLMTEETSERVMEIIRAYGETE